VSGGSKLITSQTIPSNEFIISFRLPNDGIGVPRLLKYMTMMIILTTVVLIETILLKVITTSQHIPPTWVRIFFKFLSENPILKFFISVPFESMKTESGDKENSELIASSDNDERETSLGDTSNACWTVFCRFSDRLLFIALVICYTTYNGY
jgi:hypothetical protein